MTQSDFGPVPPMRLSLDAMRLLELPLTIPGRCTVYGDRMHLSEEEGLGVCKALIKSTVSNGGVITVTWHTRSMSPEKLWASSTPRC